MFWKGLGANLTTQNKEFKMFTLKSLSTKYKQLTLIKQQVNLIDLVNSLSRK